MEKYFMMSMRFDKTLPEEFGLFPSKDSKIYVMKTDDSLWRKRDLYDLGWGNEIGFEKLPPLTFNELIYLVEIQSSLKKKRFWQSYTLNELKEYRDKENNRLGAVSVIMQDHIEELIDFLSEKINTDYFTNLIIRENFKWFSFSSQKARESGQTPGGILTQSYEDVLNKYPKWREISSQVIGKIYT